MKILKKGWLIAGAITAITLLGACEEVNDETKNTQSILENATTEPADYAAILDIMDISELDEVVDEESALKSINVESTARCFDVTIHKNDSASFWPRSWTFVYTDSTCVDYFGNTRTGLVHVNLTDFWKHEGSVRTITFEDFSINGNQMEGTKTIINTGLNEDGNLTFERSFENASYTQGDTATIEWNCNRDVEMIAGYDTFVAADDEYLVSGGAEGTNYDGLQFAINITEPLHYKKCSRFPITGSLVIIVDENAEIQVNYGNGECDNIAELTINGETSEITLGDSIL